MNKLFIFLVFQFLLLRTTFTQLNFDSLAHISYLNLHNTKLNDVWGYLDELNNEYALVGTRSGVSIVDVTVPNKPKEVYWKQSAESIWRDVNTYKNFAYITTEAEIGLQILDLTTLPNANGITSKYYMGPSNNSWSSAHTLFIDSAGYAYIFGANRGNGGVIILDIHTDPLNPIEVGVFDEMYVHDGYVLGDTMYLAHISDGVFTIVDISDKSNPKLIGSKTTRNAFTHNIWTTPDKKYAFTTDEVSGAYVGSYDVSDPKNPVLLDLIQSSPGKGVMPHNVHYLNGFLVTSYYTDGVVVFDANRPHNLIEVGNFDTYPGQSIYSTGCWASYPFLPSGTILAADITEGLFISKPTYKKACYLEGVVSDKKTKAKLSDVTISIGTLTEKSKLDGIYATGTVNEGVQNVSFSKVGYFTQTFPVNFTSGVLVNLDVELEPIVAFNPTIKVLDAKTSEPILDVHVLLEGTLTSDEKLTNGLGEAKFNLFYEEKYKVSIAKWGYKTLCLEETFDKSISEKVYLLELGYQDDFTFDLGWTTSFNQATKGFWERGKPNGSSTGSAPANDSDGDCNSNAYVTGNSTNQNPDSDEVKKGSVSLFSPFFDLVNYPNAVLSYDRWFYNYHGALPFDDSLKIIISNGTSSVLLDAQASDLNAFGNWHAKSFILADYITLTDKMQILVYTSDFDPGVNITEAGFDNFKIELEPTNSVDVLSKMDKISVFPNPTQSNLILKGLTEGSELKLVNAQGSLILQKNIVNENVELSLLNLESGIYFIEVNNQKFKVIKSDF